MIQLSDCEAAPFGDCIAGFRLDGRNHLILGCEDVKPDRIGAVVGRDGPAGIDMAREIVGVEPEVMVSVRATVRCPGTTWAAAPSAIAVERSDGTVDDALCDVVVDPDPAWGCDG